MSSLATVFYGAVINPLSLHAYQALPHCLLSIDALGNIEWVVDDVEPHNLREALASKGLVDAEVFALKDGEFIIPGFVDTHTVSHRLSLYSLSKLLIQSMHLNTQMLACKFCFCLIYINPNPNLLFAEEDNTNYWIGWSTSHFQQKRSLWTLNLHEMFTNPWSDVSLTQEYVQFYFKLFLRLEPSW